MTSINIKTVQSWTEIQNRGCEVYPVNNETEAIKCIEQGKWQYVYNTFTLCIGTRTLHISK